MREAEVEDQAVIDSSVAKGRGRQGTTTIVARGRLRRWRGWGGERVQGVMGVPSVDQGAGSVAVVSCAFSNPLNSSIVYASLVVGRVVAEVVGCVVNAIDQERDASEVLGGVDVGVAKQEGVNISKELIGEVELRLKNPAGETTATVMLYGVFNIALATQ